MIKAIDKTFWIFSVLLLFANFSFAQQDLKQIRQGNKLYNDSKYNEAEIAYRKSIEANAKQEKAYFNLGDALYKQGNYEESAKTFESLLNTTQNEKLKPQLYHNLGNAYLQQKKYTESIEAYKNALRLNPKDEDTRYNLEYAKKMLIQQQQQQQQNQQNQDNNKDKQQQQQQQDKQQQKDEQQKKNENSEQLTKEQAEKMLNALNQNEKEVQDKVKKQQLKGARYAVEKDW